MPVIDSEHTDIVWSRVDAVVVLILENERFFQSKRNGELTKTVANTFNVSEIQAFRYIKEAKREIRKIGKNDKAKAFVKAIRDLEFLLQKAKGIKDKIGKFIEKPDYKLALEIVKERNKLAGLYMEEIKHSGEVINKNIDYSKLSKRQLQRLAAGENINSVLADVDDNQ